MAEPPDGTDHLLERTADDEVMGESEVLEDAIDSLESWLVDSAEAGVPELVLVSILEAYAKEVEAHGFIPRTWAGLDDSA